MVGNAASAKPRAFQWLRVFRVRKNYSTFLCTKGGKARKFRGSAARVTNRKFQQSEERNAVVLASHVIKGGA